MLKKIGKQPPLKLKSAPVYSRGEAIEPAAGSGRKADGLVLLGAVAHVEAPAPRGPGPGGPRSA